MTDPKEGLQMAVLAVNWDDTPKDMTVNLSTIGVATGVGDNCKITDIYTGAVTNSNGGNQVFTQMAPHSHVAKKIKCLPW